jgi:hypothetical protein
MNYLQVIYETLIKNYPTYSLGEKIIIPIYIFCLVMFITSMVTLVFLMFKDLFTLRKMENTERKFIHQ